MSADPLWNRLSRLGTGNTDGDHLAAVRMIARQLIVMAPIEAAEKILDDAEEWLENRRVEAQAEEF